MMRMAEKPKPKPRPKQPPPPPPVHPDRDPLNKGRKGGAMRPPQVRGGRRGG